MPDYVIILLAGIGICILSVLLGRREKRMLENAVPVTATVVRYDEYEDNTDVSGDGQLHRMYTAVMSYTLSDGTVVEAKEQCGRGHRKYEIGQEIAVEYSAQKPDFFVVRNDRARKMAFIAVFLFGLAMVGLAVMIYLNR